MSDEDDDLDLLEERTEALWDSKITAIISQSSQKTDNVDDSGPSSYDEDEYDERPLAEPENDKTACACNGEGQQSAEADIFIASAQTQKDTACTSSGNRSKWSAGDLYSIGIGPKPEKVSTSNCQNGYRSQSEQNRVQLQQPKPSSSITVSIRPHSTPVPSATSNEDEELEDYVDSDSSDSAIEIQSSPKKVSGPRLKIKRSYHRCDDSTSDAGPSRSVQYSPSPDRPKIVAKRKSNSDSPIVISDVSDDGASSQVNKESKQTKSQTITEPPFKVSRIQNEFADGDSGQCNNFQTKSTAPLKLKFYRSPLKKGAGKHSESTANLSPAVSLTLEKGDSAGQDTTINEYIDKVIELFPDACRKWVKQRIELGQSAILQGKTFFLDNLANSMADGLYPKSSQKEAAPEPGSKDPDIIVALGNNKIKTPDQSDGGRTETDSGPPIRLYGKKSNYTSGPKGKGKAAIQKKPIRNVLDECQELSEDDEDVPNNVDESMDTVTNNEESPSSLTCESCKMTRNSDMVVQCCDGHLICNTCVEKGVKEVLSPDSQEAQIKCTTENCTSTVPESQAKKVLPNLIIELLEEKLLKQTMESITKMEDLVTCPNCCFPVVMDAGIKEFKCPNCNNMSCRYCKRPWLITSHEDCNQFTTLLQENSESKAMEPPSYWHPMPVEGDKDYIVVTLEENCVEYQHIKALFLDSLSTKTITAIRRVQNPRLWQKLCLARKHMVEDFGQNQLNEKQLFHGTNIRAFDGICREGLDWRMCGENGTAFGQGTYFAKRAAYSDRYSRTTSSSGFSFSFGTNRRLGNTLPLPPGHSSAQFAQALNLPSSFNMQHIQSSNPFTNQPKPAGTGISQNAAQMHQHLQQLNQRRQKVLQRLQQHQQQDIQSSGLQSSNNQTMNIINPFINNSQNTAQHSQQQLQQSRQDMIQMLQQQNPFTVTSAAFGPIVNNTPSFGNNNTAPAFGQGSTTAQSSFPQFGQSNGNGILATAPEPAMTTHSASSSTNKVIFTDVEDTIDSTKKYMFVARVLVGRCCGGSPNIRKPPSDPDDSKRRPFNSCVDNMANPAIFVIFDSSQCYPEYIVEYSH
ncbi:uncharacterized protein [Argopecten irradians]|uniref:uncharacterized protein n=1 Tax=Argopecten irradians TaxID=31199 RepID=UPI00371BEA82